MLWFDQVQSQVKRLLNPELIQGVSLRTLKLRTLKVLLSFGSCAVLIIWIVESLTEKILFIDQIAYPIMLAVYTFCLVAASKKPEWVPLLEKLSLGTLATYLLVYVQIYLLFPDSIDIYAMATFTQWFPMVYTTAYIFLDERQALIGSVLMYLTILVGLIVKLAIDPAGIWNETSGLIIVNMVSAHPVYIAVLSAFALLKSWFAHAQSHAEVMSIAASIDYLTGASNRRATMEALHHSLVLTKTGIPAAVLMFDIDHFKQINDTCGHDVGDTVLVELSRLLRQHLRSTDTLGRWGGEEFLVVAPYTNPVESLTLAERLRTLAESHFCGQLPTITLSCGVTHAQPDDTTQTIVKRADEALYRAKDAGRNRVEVAPMANN